MKGSFIKTSMVISLCCFLGISFFFSSIEKTNAADGGTETVHLSPDVDELPLTGKLRVLKDSEGTLQIGDLLQPPYSWKFVSNEEGEPNGGLSTDVYWLSFTVEDPTEDQEWLLELANPFIDEAILYSPVSEGGYSAEKLGNAVSNSEQFHLHQHLIFDLSPLSGETSIFFMRVESQGAKHLPLTIWEHEAFEEHSRQITAMIGLFSGLSLIFFGCCINWFFKYRQKNFLYLLLLSLVFLLTSSTWTGLSFSYIWSTLEWWSRQPVSIFFGAASIMVLFVTKELFAEKIQIPRFSGILGALTAFVFFSIAFSFFSYPTAFPLLFSAFFLSAAISFSAAFLSWKKGVLYAGPYAVAQLLFIAAVLLAFLTAVAILPYMRIIQYAIYFFSGVGLLYAAKALLAKEKIILEKTGELERQANNRQQMELEMLKNANKQKDDLLAFTSTGLRTPLYGMIGIAQSFQESTAGKISPVMTNQLNDLVASGESMAQLVNDIADLPEMKQASVPVHVEEAAGSLAEYADPNIRELTASQLADSMLKQQGTKNILNLLVVESEEINRSALLHQMALAGYQAIGAEDGETAMRMLAVEPMDLIVMDGKLNDMTGDELCRHIRKDFTLTELPILMLSNEDGIREKKDAFTAGANDYLVKPCDKEEFLLRVGTLANMRRLTQEVTNLNYFLERNVQERTMALEITNMNLLTVNDEIQEIEKSRNEMLSAISHELGTPITLIHSYIQAVKESLIEENNPRYLDMIHKKLLLLERLTEDLVELTKYKSGNMTLRFEQHELQRWMKRLMDSLASDVIQSGREFKFLGTENPDDINQAFLAVDLDRIDQVISNILWNAVKHTSTEEGQIALSMELLAKNNENALLNEEDFDGELMIRISDNGCGIKKEALPHIFDRFYKIDSSTSYKGSGLGLAIAKEIILAHKGQIWADSKEGQGSVLIIVLPLVFH